MVYTANFKAGVKVKDIKVQVNQDQVTVTLPQSQLLDKKIDPSSIKFYDQSYALFNWNQKEDITKAEQAAAPGDPGWPQAGHQDGRIKQRSTLKSS